RPDRGEKQQNPRRERPPGVTHVRVPPRSGTSRSRGPLAAATWGTGQRRYGVMIFVRWVPGGPTKTGASPGATMKPRFGTAMKPSTGATTTAAPGTVTVTGWGTRGKARSPAVTIRAWESGGTIGNGVACVITRDRGGPTGTTVTVRGGVTKTG